MEIKQLLSMQTERGAKIIGASERNKTTIDNVVSECRKELEEKSDRYRDLRVAEKKEVIRQIIIDFIMTEKPLVDGYISGDNLPDTIKLVDKLIEAITDYDFLTEAMNDDDVNEIRSNGQYIKVERNGKVEDLVDKDGNLLYFKSREQQDVILKKMLGDVKFSPANALVSGITIEGYRIAAAHSCAMGADPIDPHGEKFSTFVLRKHKDKRPSLEDVVKYGTMSDEMAVTLKELAQVGATVFTVGPTSSGKTTTNNAFLNSMDDIRLLLIQNPSEIDARKRDETGRVVNDVVHLEAHDVINPTPNDPTPENEMDMALRLSPEYIAFGEWRTNKEFEGGMKLLLAGHPVNATYHSDTVARAFRRYLQAYTAASGQSQELAAEVLADLMEIIIVQKFMKDGSRKVLEIAEITGVDKEEKTKPVINTLYKFVAGEHEYNEDGSLKKINGVHKRVGKISEELQEKFAISGLRKSDYAFLCEEPKGNDVQTYTGEFEDVIKRLRKQGK